MGTAKDQKLDSMQRISGFKESGRPEFCSSRIILMPYVNENQRENLSPRSAAAMDRSLMAPDPNAHRLDFRHASAHLSQKRPGYYLILLRNKIRHRSLREKPSLIH
jgi:hypothetical protein